MHKQSVCIGEIVIDNEPRISLYAETTIPLSRAGIAVIKDKLAFLLDTRFRPAAPEQAGRYMSIDEVVETWECYRATVLRMIRDGQLHPIGTNGDMLFDRAEILRLANSIPSDPG